MAVLRRFMPLLAVLAVGAAVVAVVLSAAGPVEAAPADPPADAGVQVQGVGTATGTPDVLHISIGVEAGAASVADALAAANAAAQKVHDALHGAGIADADLQTVNVHIYPRYDGNGQKTNGYLAGQDITATVRDMGSAGATISTAVAAGGDAARLQGISYELADDAALRSHAREQAFADARSKAEQYAKLAGRVLGDVVLMREEVTGGGPVPMATADSAVAGAGAVPIAPGSTEVTVTAEVRWSLR